jgi:hypothetical protein
MSRMLGIVVSYCLRSRAIHCRKAVLPTHSAARPHESEARLQLWRTRCSSMAEINGRVYFLVVSSSAVVVVSVRVVLPCLRLGLGVDVEVGGQNLGVRPSRMVESYLGGAQQQ